MIDIDKYKGYTGKKWNIEPNGWQIYAYGGNNICRMDSPNPADAQLVADAPLFLELIQKIVKDWCKPNQCNGAFGKDVRQLMYEYGLITFNEETRRYEVKEWAN